MPAATDAAATYAMSSGCAPTICAKSSRHASPSCSQSSHEPRPASSRASARRPRPWRAAERRSGRVQVAAGRRAFVFRRREQCPRETPGSRRRKGHRDLSPKPWRVPPGARSSRCASSGEAETNTTRSGLNARPSSAAACSATSAASRRGFLSARENAEDPGNLALHLVRDADGGGLGDGRVGDHGGLDLGRADALARDVERVVGAAVQEPVAVLVHRRPVAVHPDPGKPAPVRVEVALGVAPEAPCHPRERLPADELPDLAALDERVALLVDDVHIHPERGAAERARFDRDRRRGREKARADLGPARAVDDRAAAAADSLGEPVVRIRVPRLAGRDDDAQGGEVGLRVAVLHESANQRRRAAEDAHGLGLDRAPEPVGREIGSAFGEDQLRSHRAAADDGPRAHDPAHVRGEVDDVVGVCVGLVGELAADGDEEAALDVRALPSASRSCPRYR